MGNPNGTNGISHTNTDFDTHSLALGLGANWDSDAADRTVEKFARREFCGGALPEIAADRRRPLHKAMIDKLAQVAWNFAQKAKAQAGA